MFTKKQMVLGGIVILAVAIILALVTYHYQQNDTTAATGPVAGDACTLADGSAGMYQQALLYQNNQPQQRLVCVADTATPENQ